MKKGIIVVWMIALLAGFFSGCGQAGTEQTTADASKTAQSEPIGETVSGVTQSEPEPGPVELTTPIVKIAAGFYNSYGIRPDGTVAIVGNRGNGIYEAIYWEDIVCITGGNSFCAGVRKDGAVLVAGYKGFSEAAADWTDITELSAYSSHAVGLRRDGTVTAYGNNYAGQCDVFGWSDITSVSAGEKHTLGLRADGTVVATGDNEKHQCEVSEWRDIVSVACGGSHSIGLKRDGTVVLAGTKGGDVSGWTDIVAIAAGEGYSVGLKGDGTVVAVGSNDYGQCNVSEWTEITEIAAGVCHTVGLKKDGTVVAAGLNASGQRNVETMNLLGLEDDDRYLSAPPSPISAGFDHTVILLADGTVAVVGSNEKQQCSVPSDVRDIVSVCAGYKATFCVRKDGFVYAVGYDNPSMNPLTVSGWRDIVAVTAEDEFSAGLRKDGTVVGNCRERHWLNDWDHIVAIDSGTCHLVALRDDGTVETYQATNHGDYSSGQDNTRD